MAKRGRKSSTSVAVVPPVDPAEIESIARPEPPECLDVSARDVWLDVVDNLPADWFEPVMLPVLEQYCRHVVEARRLNALIVQAVEKHSFYSPMRLRQEPIAKNYTATPPGGLPRGLLPGSSTACGRQRDGGKGGSTNLHRAYASPAYGSQS